MKRFYCTYFDRNYLIKAIALIGSLNKHEKNDFEIFAVCLDEITRLILDKLNLPNVTLIPMHEIEQGDAALLATKMDRSPAEYYWTATSTVMLRIFERYPRIDILTYIDADILFYSSPEPIFKELDGGSVLIHEHRFSPRVKHFEKWGKYNVGLICFRNNSTGIDILKWWRERCLEWCYENLEDGKYGDQMYLNDWTTRFEGVKVLQHIGAAVAPWNHDQYTYKRDDTGNILINGTPLIFYHYHTFMFETPEIVSPVGDERYALSIDILSLLFVPYLNALLSGLSKIKAIIPDFSFGLFNKKYFRSSKNTYIAKHNIGEKPSLLELPELKEKLDKEWDCYCSPQMSDYADIQKSVYPDLKVYPTICTHCRQVVNIDKKGKWLCPICNNEFVC